MKKISSIFATILFLSPLLWKGAGAKIFSQNNSLLLNGAYMKLNGGVSATPIYLVVNQANSLGITRTSGHIISEGDFNFVKWNCGATNASYVFPFGVSTTDYIPFTFNKTAGAANVSISTYGTGADNTTWSNGVTNMGSAWGGSATGSVIDRWWRVNATGNTADMTFSYKASENNTTSSPTAITWPQQWDNAAVAWLAPLSSGGPGVTSGVGTINSGSTNFFSADKIVWILVKAESPLPIELMQFSAECIPLPNGEEQGVGLQWATASETNNDFFTIERSVDAINFTAIGTVQGAGNSSTIHNYTFTDFQPTAGSQQPTTLYYRLTQTDYNGQSQTFYIVSVSPCAVNSEFSVTITQNPVSDGNINILVKGAANTTVFLGMTDALGQVVYSKDIIEASDRYLFNMNIRNSLASGIYFITASCNNKYISQKLLISSNN